MYMYMYMYASDVPPVLVVMRWWCATCADGDGVLPVLVVMGCYMYIHVPTCKCNVLYIVYIH